MFTSLKLKFVTELMNENATELVKKIKRDYIDNNKVVNLKVYQFKFYFLIIFLYFLVLNFFCNSREGHFILKKETISFYRISNVLIAMEFMK